MKRNEIQYLHHYILVVGFIFVMKTILLSSALVSNNKTMVDIKCIETERNALLDIKGDLIDKNGYLSSWGSSQEQENCCHWRGIGCDIHTGHVTHLNLSFVGYCTLSSSLLHLSNLTYLDLSSNSCVLTIPSFVGSLTNLVHLDLSKGYFQGEIPDELGNLFKLTYLDLSSNHLLSGPIPDFIGSLTSLTYLDLSHNRFYEAIPQQLGNLSKLHYLDLAYNYLKSDSIVWLFNLSSLAYLDLSGIDIGNNWASLLHKLPSLSVLHLTHCNLNSTRAPSSSFTNSSAPLSVLHLSNNQLDLSVFYWISNSSSITTLVDLDLSNNVMQGQIPDTYNMGSLINLDLSNNVLQGRIPNSFGVMTGITFLNLSANQLEGVLPNSFHYLSSLQIVDFSHNNFSGNLQDIFSLLPEATLQKLWISKNQLTGSLPDITRFSFLRELKVDSNQLNGHLPQIFEHRSVLQSLNLSNNHLQGYLPDFTRFSFLENLDLNDNKFSGSLPDFTGCLSLKNLLLGGNEFTGWETRSIGQLTNLYQLDLSMNLINSTINEHHLSKLYSLRLMDASFNSMTFNMSSEWLPPFNLNELSLASCKLGPKFPIWIRNQTHILSLDLSNTQISDTIPMWFWNISTFTFMKRLDLSFNKIYGTYSSSMQLNIADIDLSYNYFEGPVPLFDPGCVKINLSHNKFSGKLLALSQVTRLGIWSWSFLDLSHNLLFGEVPDNWLHFERLVFLDLGNNKFSGRIPTSIGNLTFLQTLILRNNNLNGELPESLRNCTNLEFVDLGLNSLSGTLPAWIGQDLPQLYALILKSNRFYGGMPNDLCHLTHLRFLDLSMNRISRNVPQCFSNLTAMIENGTGITDHRFDPSRFGGCVSTNVCSLPATVSYLDDAFAQWKGIEREYGKNFAYLKMIDLSSNELTGEIPIGITRLLNLKGLNLSSNKFYGKVPVEIGRLLMLETLDLSGNKFSGEIPQSISGLTFLSYLDLSSNNLSGRIPLGIQLQTFNSSAYEGNPGLCGIPLTRECPGVEPSSNENEVDEDEIVYKRGLYISATLGFSTTFWGMCATLVLKRHWRHAYFHFLTNLKDRLYVFMIVHSTRLKAWLQG